MPRHTACRPTRSSVIACLAGLAAVLLARVAGAQCPPAVDAWAAHASRDLGVRVRAVECPEGRARLRLVPADARPIDVEVAYAAGPAFRRAGALGVSPIVEVPDYRMLPAPQRAAFEALVEWLGAHDAEVVRAAGRVPTQNAHGARQATVDTPRGGSPLGPWPWAAILALVLAWRASRGASVELRGSARALAALTGFALALRLAWGVWGPLQGGGAGVRWLRLAYDGAGAEGVGRGYAELFHWATLLVPRGSDRAVFALDAMFSAAAPALLFLVARMAGLDRRRALAAGVLLAADPVSVRIGATEAFFNPIVALTLGHWLCLGALVRHAAVGRRGHAFAAAAGAAFAAVAAARVHPAGWMALALSPLVGFALAPASLSRRRAGALLAASSAVTALWVWLLGALDAAVQPPAWFAAQGGSGPGARMVLAVLFAVAATVWVRAARPRALGVVGVAYFAAAVALRGGYAQSTEWLHAYDRLYAGGVLLGLATVCPEAWAAGRAFAAALAAAAGTALLFGGGGIARRTTEQREYAWLRPRLMALPASCRPVFVGSAGGRLLAIADYLAPGSRRGHAWGASVSSGDAAEAAVSSAPCAVYVRTSLCSTGEGRPACEAVEHALGVRLADSVTLPAVPSERALAYDSDVVTVGVAPVGSSQK